MSQERIRTRTAAAALIASALALAGCGSSPGPAAPATPPEAGGPVRVVASTDVYGSIVAAVGGDRVEVTSIIDRPDVDPHEYEATAGDAAAVGAARIVVRNGGGYDDFAGDLVAAAGTGPQVVDVVELSGLEQAAPAGGDGPGFNEHVWYSLSTMAGLADRLAADLGAADPAGAATYTANAEAFTARIGGLSDQLAAIRAAHAGQRVVVTEPVPLHLTQDAGLENVTPEQFSEAVEEGSDPSAAVLNETLQLVSGGGVRVLVANAQTEGASTRAVEDAATTASVPVVRMSETLPDGVTDYVDWQAAQIGRLAAALDAPGA